MTANEEIGRAIGELHENRNSRDCQNFIFLCESIIKDTREDNDTAGVRRVIRNQGKIDGLKEVLAYIETGNPSVSEFGQNNP
jgi:hypothetical protein